MPAILTQQTVTTAYALKLGHWGVSERSNVQSDSEVPHVDQASDTSTDWMLMWRLQRNAMFSSQYALTAFAFLIGASWLLWHFGVLNGWSLGLLTLTIFVLSMVAHDRHGADQDFIGLRPELLRVETHRAGQVLRWDFNPRWVRIEPLGADGSLVHLSGQGKSVDVGRFIRTDLRQQLANELRWAVRQMTH